MSGNKIRSLRLRRSGQRSQTPSTIEADESMILAAETKTHVERIELSSRIHESSARLHSTPKKSGEKSNSAQDQGAIDYRVSPILLPCTQDGGSDVAWDWDSPRAKAKLRKSKDAEPVGTPKRTTMLQKKRNSNSPLLYMPIKRKLLPNNQESIDLFTAEMKAISEQVKTAPRGNDDAVAGQRSNEPEDELLVDVDLGDFSVDAADESSRPKNGQTAVPVTSMDDLFDDSIEDCMVKCSQEVEEKLRLESAKRNSDTSGASGKESLSSWHRNSYSRVFATRDKTADGAGNSSRSATSSSTAKNPPSGGVKSSTPMSPRSIPRSSNSSAANVSAETRASQPTVTNLKLSRILTKSRATKLSCQSPNQSKSTSVISGQPKLPPVASNQAKSAGISSQSKSVASYQPKSSCINNNVTAKSGKTASDAASATLTEVFEIPDDSFDDFIAVCCDEPENTAEKSERRESSGRYGKVYVSPHSAGSSENSKRFDGSRARKVLLPPPAQSSASLAKSSATSSACGSAGKIFSRSASNDSVRASGKSSVESPTTMTTITTITTATTNHGRKFFKTKSLSTSSFDEHANAKNTSGTANNSSLCSRGWKSNMFANGKTNSSVSSNSGKKTIMLDYNEIPPRTNGSGSVEVNRIGVNVDRNGPRSVDSLRSASEESRVNGKSQQQQQQQPTTGRTQSATICTPEEIERKRQEARMKLEAKRLLMARSASSGSLGAAGNPKGFVKR